MSTVASTAAATTVSQQLRQLADTLDQQGISSASQVAEILQKLAQQLLRQAASPSAPGIAAAAAPTGGTTAEATAAPATETVEALERSYGAPAVPGVGGGDEQRAEQQPHTKKQRRAQANGQPPRVFDFSKYEQRFVALHLMYVGWSYQGFARQADSENTIEGVLFPVLRKVRLIPEDCEVSSLDYSRCGRTDKGVSALGQVLSLKLRSSALFGQPLPPPDQELDYPAVINRALPDTIRVLGWCDAPSPDFSARFSCLSREYKYFIVQDGSLDVGAMQAAAQHLLGEHDFRNFCKADVVQVQNFKRHVLSVSLEPVTTACTGMTVLALHIKGTAFLWHQVRCIAAVLLMVGRGLEAPSIVAQLLDTSKVPRKPQFSMAAEEPLLLYRCGFEGLNWQCSQASLSRNLNTVGSQLQQHLVATALTSAIYEQLQQDWMDLQSSSTMQPLQQQQQQQEQQEPSPGPSLQQTQQQQQQQLDGHPQQGGRCASSTNGSSSGGGGGGDGGSSSSSTGRWVVPKPPHISLLKRATEPSMEERFHKAGISLELLNQPGGARARADDM